MKTNKILAILLGLSLACIVALLAKFVGQNEPNTAGNQSEQNLSKYRTLYARPVSEWDKPKLDESVVKEWREFEPFKEPPFPENNAYSDIKAFLGLRLFNDPRLSKSGQISCQN